MELEERKKQLERNLENIKLTMKRQQLVIDFVDSLDKSKFKILDEIHNISSKAGSLKTIFVLYNIKGKIRFTDLSTITDISAGSLNKTLDKLIELKFISKEVKGRISYYCIDELGIEFYEKRIKHMMEENTDPEP